MGLERADLKPEGGLGGLTDRRMDGWMDRQTGNLGPSAPLPKKEGRRRKWKEGKQQGKKEGRKEERKEGRKKGRREGREGTKKREEGSKEGKGEGRKWS